MKTIRDVLNTIKGIQGIKTDAELAQLIGVHVDTMRNWIQKDTIKKQLMQYCFDSHISIDEVFFGNPTFSKERCEKCKKKSTCSVYREALLTSVTVKEIGSEMQIITNTEGKEQFTCELHSHDSLISNCSIHLKDVARIFIKLR